MRFRDGQKPKNRWGKRLLICLIAILAISTVSVFMWYQSALEPVNKYDNTPTIITIEKGMNDAQVGSLLDTHGFVSSGLAYEIYVRLGRKSGSIQAGSYTLSKSMGVKRIVDKLSSGEVAVDLITILPGKRLDEIRKSFIDAGYSISEVDEALKPENYIKHPALRDKPRNASLEGYLYPESFQRTATTPLKTIIEKSLDQMADVLSDSVEKSLRERGFGLHEAVILASIVEKEAGNNEDKPTIAQVFETRFSIGMNLGSDVTAYYGADVNNLEHAVTTDTPYNTRLYTGLPPGPISNVSATSIQAVVEPSNTDYLYFVAGDDGITYFSHTIEEHEALTAEHCKQLCSMP
ncbi:MAG TPA: endolytic transglycosylase MltG [Candidatus Saccharibacteria bacterium]|jgi:UPF0755 protein|nr:endolytic transglycosylase MltG [Candidatus Saccharibacteria bacterium]HMT55968.1 endolytic transglycosylase MltG [Candidatus Saccharibacteria bacterium]